MQPDDGVEPVLQMLGEARRTLRTVQFTLDDPRFVQAVLDALKPGEDLVALQHAFDAADEAKDEPAKPE